MRAGLDDFAVSEDVDEVSVDDCGESVSDYDGRAAVGEAVEGVLDFFFVFAIECAGGFVEEQDAGVLEDGSGDGDALFLASGELAASRADEGVHLPLELLDEVQRVGLGEGCLELCLAGRGLGEQQVLSHGHGEEHGFLPDVRDVLSERLQVELADAAAVH